VSVEEAQRIGYETAMRWTKGKYQFFVCTHNDRGHLHSHIYYNSTREDSTRKFHNFIGSTFFVRRLSDRICLEHSLSVIHHPKQHSDSKFKHYGQWQGDNKPLSFQERLKIAIANTLEQQPQDFNTFLSLMGDAGFEHKYGRGGALSFRTEGQIKYTRLRTSTLGDGYSIEDIQAVIDGGISYDEWQEKTTPNEQAHDTKPTPRKFNLVIDIQEKMQQGKGAAYEKWATVYNLKQMAAALQYIQENKLLAYEDLATKAEKAADRFHNLSDKLKQTESAIKRNTELKSAIIDYAKTRPIFDEYKSKKYSNKYLVEHEADITVYHAAQSTIKELLNGAAFPKMADLKAEFDILVLDKKTYYAEYKAAQKDMKEAVVIKANIDHLLGLTTQQQNKEMER